MDFATIEAWPRTLRGKGPNARLRREGKIPAVSYGKGLESRSLAISPVDLLRALQGPYGRNVVMKVRVGDEDEFPALVADFTYHPLTRALLHADFLHIDLAAAVDIDIPLTCVGKPVGVTTGGTLRQVYRAVPVRCLPADIPREIAHDVTELDHGDVVKVAEIAVPEGVTILLAPEQTVLAVVAPVIEAEETPAEGEIPAEGDAGATETPEAEGKPGDKKPGDK